jgi:hypothetical protein
MNTTSQSHTTSNPHWYNAESMSTWDRVKEALRRDWEQTKQDLGLSGGHELNQDVADTVKQATNAEPIPADDRLNPPKVIGTWDAAEYPIGYGYTARRTFGKEHPTWNEGLEQRLRADWEAHKKNPEHGWGQVKGLIRYGYDYSPKS